MTGLTSSQSRLISHLEGASTDRTVVVEAFFEGVPRSFVVRDLRHDVDGMLEFTTPGDETVRIRADTLIGVVETLELRED